MIGVLYSKEVVTEYCLKTLNLMKKLSLYFKNLATVCVLATTLSGAAQSPCNSSFIYSINPGGIVTFTSTTTNTTSITAFNWAINNVFGVYTGPNPTMTFSANGGYYITLQTTNYSPSCTAQSTQSFVINNASCGLIANFYYNSGTNGATTFINQSSGTDPGVTYAWDFGDNSPISTLVSPVHTYSADGVYSATLVANNNFTNSCVSTKILNISVCSYAPIVPSYSFTQNAGGNVTFTSTSTGVISATTYTWGTYNTYFNNSNIPFATGVNLTQSSTTFSANGWHYTYLTIVNPITSCGATLTQSINVNNTFQPCNLNASFGATQGNGGSMTLNNYSSGTLTGTTYSWNFGDGTNGTGLSPIHTYSADGLYTATLTANNNTTNTCISSVVATVKVCGYNAMTAGFVSTINNGGNVTFTSTSTGTTLSTNYTWINYNFSPNIVFASGTNVTQASTVFPGNGTQNVYLTITDPITTCANTASQTILVNSACVADASFSITSTNTPQVWNVLPTSPLNVTAAFWTWGDGATSNTLYTSHTYTIAGYYPICLSVTVNCGTSNTYCNNWYVFKGSNSNEMIQVDVVDPATVGIRNNSVNQSFITISPNPNNGSFNLNMTALNKEVIIIVNDLTGKVIYSETAYINNGKLAKEINLTETPAGIYFLNVVSDGQTLHKKMVIEK